MHILSRYTSVQIVYILKESMDVSSAAVCGKVLQQPVVDFLGYCLLFSFHIAV